MNRNNWSWCYVTIARGRTDYNIGRNSDFQHLLILRQNNTLNPLREKQMYNKAFYENHREEMIERSKVYYYERRDDPEFIKKKKNYDRVYHALKRSKKQRLPPIEFKGPCIVSFN
jgi:hypothetical protein